MKKSLLSIALVFITMPGLLSQESPVLLTIGGEEVTLSEFERIYRKNNNENSLNRQTPEEYLELFINFKLKVKEAESLGMDTTTKFINELEGYRKQLAKPYLADEETREEMMMEAYERAGQDVSASHILIKVPSNATPEDTLAAYQKISGIRERILKGEDFETVARATSDDSSVKRNGGFLGYFTVFSMIYAFENAAYTTPVGELSMPFRSSYGYHLLMVHDRRPARGQVKVAHIFIRTPEEMGEEMKKEAYAKVQMVYDSLQLGKSFAAMAMNHSEDPGSAPSGGEIPWFGTGRMISEFEEAAFGLQNKGDYSKPFKSFYGWHIVKLIDTKGIGTFDEMKPELQEKANRGERHKYHTARYVSKLKTEYGFSEYPEALEQACTNADSSILAGGWNAAEMADDQTPLSTIGARTATLGEFARYMEKNQERGKWMDIRSNVISLYEGFTNDLVLAYEESKLPEKYPEFRYIYEEYHDGILLFDIMDQLVWTKAVNDTSGLESFHKAHRQDYMWQKRSDAILVACDSGTNVSGVRKAYKKIQKGRLGPEDLNGAYCTNDTLPCITLSEVLLEKGENELVDAMNWQVGLGPIVEEDGKSIFVILRDVRNPEPKRLDEARGQITSDYQNHLEKEWIVALKKKYPVEVDRSLLDRIKS